MVGHQQSHLVPHNNVGSRRNFVMTHKTNHTQSDLPDGKTVVITSPGTGSSLWSCLLNPQGVFLRAAICCSHLLH